MSQIADLQKERADRVGWEVWHSRKDLAAQQEATRKRTHTFCSHLVFKAFTQINLFTLSTEPATDAMSFSSPI